MKIGITTGNSAIRGGGDGNDVPAFSNCCARSFQFGWYLLVLRVGGFLSLMVVVESSLSLKSCFRTASLRRVIGGSLLARARVCVCVRV